MPYIISIEDALREMHAHPIWSRLSPVTRRCIEDVATSRETLSRAAKLAAVKRIKDMVEADLAVNKD